MGLHNLTAAQPPAIDEIVGLLAVRSPGDLAAIRRRFPNAQKLLTEGIVAGPEDVADRQMQVRVEATLKGLNVAEESCDEKIADMKRQLRLARRLDLLGKVISAVGGASVLATLAQHFPVAGAYIGGILSLVGVLLPLFASYARQSSGGQNAGVVDQFRELVECAIRGQQLKSEMERWLALSGGGDAIPGEVFKEANDLCARVYRIVVTTGAG
jgi:hypothetical protein